MSKQERTWELSDIDATTDLYWAVRDAVSTIRRDGKLRVLVTGSRKWEQQAPVEAMLFGVAAIVGDGKAHLTDGAAPGLDDMAHVLSVWHMAAKGWTTHREPANWFAGWRSSGRNPGHERNQKMVDLGHDVCFGFPDPVVSPGTWDCLKRAHLEGIATFFVTNRSGKWALEKYNPLRAKSPQEMF